MSANAPPVLRPLNIADILDQSIRLYRQNFAPFLGIVAIIWVPVGVAQMAFAYVMGTLSETFSQAGDAVPWGQLGVMGLALGGYVLVMALAIPLGQGALSIAVSRRYLNQPITVADAYRTIGSRWGLLIAAVLLMGVAVSIGLMMCLVPGLVLSLLWMFVAPIVAIEGFAPVDAMKRSQKLIEGEWWRCLGTYLLLNILTSVISSAVAWPVAFISVFALGERNVALMQMISQGAQVAVSIIIQPVQITGLVLMYYDMRVRKEGFDLELLAKAMGAPVPSPSPIENPIYTSAPPPVDYVPPPPPPGWSGGYTSPPPPPVAPLFPVVPPVDKPPPPSVEGAEAADEALLPDDTSDYYKP